MKYVTVKNNGQITGEGETDLTIEDIKKFSAPDNQIVGVPEGLQDLGEYVFKDNQFIHIGSRPSENHAFNYSSLVWEIDFQKAWANVRLNRDRLLNDCDWMVVKAQETGIPISDDWLTYRESLRDITKQTNPTTIKWPRKPGK